MNKTPTFEDIQKSLLTWFGETVKPETNTARIIEQTYVKGLRDGGATIPPIVDIYLQTGLWLVNKPEKKLKSIA